MNLGKTKKRLLRELTANPKKAGMLGLLLLVALYFWAPLMKGWLPGGSKSTASKTAAADSTNKASAATNKTESNPSLAKKSEPVRHPWRRVAEWMDADPLMSPAVALPGTRDPLLASAERIGQLEVEGMTRESQQLTLNPASLGLVLTSTVIGPQRRVALIDGRAYVEGRRVEKEFRGNKVVFQLAEVHPRHVVLVSDGQRFELKIEAVGLAGSLSTQDEENEGDEGSQAD